LALRPAKALPLVDRVNPRGAGGEQHGHRREQRPTLPRGADHPAEGVGQGRSDHHDQRHLQQVGERGRVLERVSGIGVEEAAPVPAQKLDGFL
jgi:hypothetical protein